MIIEEKIDLVIEHTEQNKISINQILYWREIHKEDYKYDIIHNAHTRH